MDIGYTSPEKQEITSKLLYDHAWNNGGNDRDELEGILGINFYSTDNWIFSFEASNSFFREDIENTRLMINFHLTF